jgi:2-hydroxychromene-2-carboxylate isomerase
MSSLEFFFDFSSPWTYMAFTRVDAICADTGAELTWKPFYVAAVFREVNHNVADMRARPVSAKLAYYKSDMQRCAERRGIKIARSPVYGGGSAPLNSAKALRGAFVALDTGVISKYASAVFRAYWEELRDVSEDAVLGAIAGSIGLDASDFLTRIDTPPYRNRLRETTDELIRRGGFGTPTFFVDGDQMYFGNDRLDFVSQALARQNS